MPATKDQEEDLRRRLTEAGAGQPYTLELREKLASVIDAWATEHGLDAELDAAADDFAQCAGCGAPTPRASGRGVTVCEACRKLVEALARKP